MLKPLLSLTSRLDFLLILLLVLLSGNPAIYFGNPEIVRVCVAVFLFALIMFRNGVVFTKRSVLVVISFVTIFFLQSFFTDRFYGLAMLGFLTTLVTGYAVIRLAPKFTSQYVNVLFYLSLLSFIFYFPAQLLHVFGFDFKSLFEFMKYETTAESQQFYIYLHNFRVSSNPYIENEEWRNAGLFWEPGAFSGYLSLALIFLSITKKEFTAAEYRNRFSVLSVALLTTFSTAGFFVYSLIVLFLYADIRKLLAHKKTYIVVFILAISAPLSIPVVSMQLEKVAHEIEHASLQSDRYGMTRLGGLIFDLNYIAQRPLLGWGADQQARLEYDPSIEVVLKEQGNGLTGFIVKFGLAGLFLVLYFTWKGFTALTASHIKSALIVLVLMLLLLDEYFLNFPLFLSLLFLGKQNLSHFSERKI
jgi:hypothetical protein